jgi:hypothetical protein
MFSGLSIKVAAIIAAGAVAAGGGGALAASSPTVQHGFSSIAQSFNKGFAEKVEDCKTTTRMATTSASEDKDQGIGKCVSAAAHKRNALRKAAHEEWLDQRAAEREADKDEHEGGRNHSRHSR